MEGKEGVRKHTDYMAGSAVTIGYPGRLLKDAICGVELSSSPGRRNL
ncbi:MAG: hypothetical protein JWQ98_1612 [Chlorobi bacterium]|jgi:hypothetical protein|nr:hypothetical protein [Chlorobiota bacterium]